MLGELVALGGRWALFKKFVHGRLVVSSSLENPETKLTFIPRMIPRPSNTIQMEAMMTGHRVHPQMSPLNLSPMRTYKSSSSLTVKRLSKIC